MSRLSKAAIDEQSKIDKELAKLDVQEKRLLDAYREAIIDLDELRRAKSQNCRKSRQLASPTKSRPEQARRL